jgi:hypothetical protein
VLYVARERVREREEREERERGERERERERERAVLGTFHNEGSRLGRRPLATPSDPHRLRINCFFHIYIYSIVYIVLLNINIVFCSSSSSPTLLCPSLFP